MQRNLRREEILDFMIAGYPMYAWSIRSLSRRLQHFGIKYTDYDIELEDIKKAVKKGVGRSRRSSRLSSNVAESKRGTWTQCVARFSIRRDGRSRPRRTEIPRWSGKTETST
jgi:hypothetical protein